MNSSWMRTAPLVVSLMSLSVPRFAAAQEVMLIAGGDIEWSRMTKAPGIYFDARDGQREDGWVRMPYLNTPETRAYLETLLDRELETPRSHHIRAIHYGLEFASLEDMARYPFGSVVDVLRSADIAFANLETPLSDNARYVGAFRTPTAFADGLRWAGLDVVSTANNHALDAEGEGLRDTLASLWRVGIGTVGTGRHLEDARRPFVTEHDGVRIAFLGYTWSINLGASGFALPDHAGAVPLDPFILRQDIERIRADVDYVVLSFHWGIENSQDVHPAARDFAHQAVDAGADIILGHHPHLPRGIEVYRGKVIVYSLGNFIFGHNHTYWMDNYLVRLTLGAQAVTRVEILPIAGTGNDLSQPYLLTGERAQTLLEDVRTRSALFDTRLTIEGDVGVIRPERQ